MLKNLSLSFDCSYRNDISNLWPDDYFIRFRSGIPQYQFAEDVIKIVGPDLGIQLSNKATSGAAYNLEQLVGIPQLLTN